MMKNPWSIIHEYDDKYAAEVKRSKDIVTLAICKSFTSAKRWVTMNINHSQREHIKKGAKIL